MLQALDKLNFSKGKFKLRGPSYHNLNLLLGLHQIDESELSDRINLFEIITMADHLRMQY